ncbi:MAG: AMP-binding protein [Deltaproteobacteria bacterium]|nr:AMP-binding protein [Deltaproteobacteria bacterium]
MITFSLESEIPFRVHVFNNQYILFVFHHISVDFHSIEILIHDLLHIYFGKAVNTSNFQEFVDFERRALEDKEAAKHWNEFKISDLEDVTSVSAAHAGNKCTFFEIELSKLSWNSINNFARENATTPYSVFLFCYHLTLSYFRHHEETIVFTPCLNRSSTKLRKIVGSLVNIIPTIMNWAGEKNLQTTYKKFETELRKSLIYQHYPLSKILEGKSEIKGIKYLFSYHKLSTPYFKKIFQDFGSVQHISQEGSLSDILVTINEFRDKCTIQFQSNGIVNDFILKQFAASFENLVQKLDQFSSVNWEQFDYTSALQKKWLDECGRYTDEQNYITQFEFTALNNSKKLAVMFKDQSLNYSELYQQSKSIASELQAMGIKPGDPVGVFCERNLSLPGILLGIWMSGAYYIPLDPKYPEDRLSYIIANSKIEFIVSNETLLRDKITKESRIIFVDEKFRTQNSYEEIKIDELPAYVIYTSGSTGNPKGVRVGHKSVQNLLAWARKEYSDYELEEILFSTSICFDISIFEIFLPLLIGGRINIVENIMDLIERPCHFEKTTLINTVPSAIKTLMATGLIPPKVKTVNLAGEALHLSVVKELYGFKQIESVVNLYGPTEATVYSMMKRIPKSWDSEIPIGKPIAGVIAQVLDKELRPVIAGTIGELYLSGPCLSEGYLGGSVGGFHEIQGHRVYATGDLVSHTSEKDFLYHGRRDSQVKLRGLRIEFGEIENILLSHSNVVDAVAYVKGEHEKAILLAIVSTSNAVDNLEQDLKVLLRKKLTEYMIPDKIYISSTIPCQPNGKIDRKALKNFRVEENNHKGKKSNQGPIESILSIFNEVLGSSSLDSKSCFLQEGGNSLLATIAAKKISECFEISCTPGTIMSYSRVGELAEALKLSHHDYPEEKYWPLSSAQAIIHYDPSVLNIPYLYNVAFAEETTDSIDKNIIEQRIQNLLDKTLLSRLRISKVDGETHNVISTRKQLNLEVIQIDKSLFDKTSQNLAKLQFNLAEDLLVKVYLLRSSSSSRLLIVSHHLILDGLSYNIIREALSDATIFSLKPYDNKDSESKDLRYWKDYLPQNINKSGDLDLTYEASSATGFGLLREQIPQETLLQIRHLTQSGITPFSAYISAIQILRQAQGENSPLIGAVFSGRNENNLDAIGNYVKVLPIATQFDEELTLFDLAKKTSATIYAHLDQQSIDANSLLQLIRERTNSHDNMINPYQIVISYQNASIKKALSLGNSQFSNVVLPNISTKFPITLTIRDNDHREVELAYDKKFVSDAFAKQFIQNFLKITSQLKNGLQKPIKKFSWWKEQEVYTQYQEHSLIDSNTTKQVPSLLEQFEKIAEQYGDKIALHDPRKDKCLTYKELDLISNRIARWLVSQNVKSKVAINTKSRSNFIVMMLSTLKIGSCYVPISHSLPESAQKDILEQIKADLYVGEIPISDLSSTPRTLSFEQINRLSHEASNSKLLSVASDLAYIMFTSGSEGAPKGVKIPTKGIVPLVCNTNYIQITPKDILLQHSDLAFDASNFEIWGALLNGATLILSPSEKLTLREMTDQIRGKKLTILWLTKSYFDLLANHDPSQFKLLKYLLVGGEALNPSFIKRVQNICPSLKIINGYGPTETTTFSACGPYTNTLFQGRIPLGSPVTGDQILIVNEDKNVLPFSCVGEIAIASPGLMHGYLGENSQKIIEKKIFGKQTKFYLSGDKGRILSNGQIDHLGRNDYMIKYRGYRINCEYIANTLQSQFGSDLLFAYVRLSQKDKDKLEAIILINKDKSHNSVKARLESFVTEHFPLYMRPNRYCYPLKLVCNKNGKIDLEATIATQQVLDVNIKSDVQAENRTNKVDQEIKHLIKIIANNLGAKLDLSKSFFANGGDSLKAIEVIHIAESQGIELKLNSLISQYSLNDILKLQKPYKTANNLKVQTKTVSSYPLLDSQKGILFSSLLDPSSDKYLVMIQLQAETKLKNQHLSSIASSLCHTHPILTMRLCLEKGDYYLSYSETNPTFEETTEQKWKYDLQQPLEIEQQLIKLSYFETKEGKTCINIAVHHIIFDLWSAKLLIDDLKRLIDGKEIQEQNNLFTEYLFEQSQIKNLAENNEYWHQYLDSTLTPISWPEYNNSASNYAKFVEESIEIKALPQEYFCKGINTFWISSLLWTLHLLTNQNNIMIGVPRLNRSNRKYQNTIGCFVETWPICFYASKHPDFLSLINSVSDSLIQHAEHRYSPAILREYFSHHHNEEMFQVLYVDSTKNIDISEEKLKVNFVLNKKAKTDFLFRVINGPQTRINIEYSDKVSFKTVGKFITLLKDHLKSLELPSPQALKNELSSKKPQPIVDVVRAIYESILDRSIDKESSFFDQGGNSLQLMQVYGQLKEKGYKLSLNNLLTNSSPMDLSRVLKSNCSKKKRIILILPDLLERGKKETLIKILGESYSVDEIATDGLLICTLFDPPYLQFVDPPAERSDDLSQTNISFLTITGRDLQLISFRSSNFGPVGFPS